MAEERGEDRPRRVLRRSRTDRVLAGVCGGIARYFGVDAVLVRIGFVALGILGGSGLLLYLVAWLMMPEAGEGDEEPLEPRRERGEEARLLLGAGLIAAGAVALLGQFIPYFWRVFWPLLLVAAGVAVIIGAGRR